MDRPSSSASEPTSEYKCAVCWSLLLDPVVARCGHDFCRGCYCRFHALQSDCPLCRKRLGKRVPGICLRLRSTIEDLFPQQLAARRTEAAAEAAAEAERADHASSQTRQYGSGRIDILPGFMPWRGEGDIGGSLWADLHAGNASDTLNSMSEDSEYSDASEEVEDFLDDDLLDAAMMAAGVERHQQRARAFDPDDPSIEDVLMPSIGHSEPSEDGSLPETWVDSDNGLRDLLDRLRALRRSDDQLFPGHNHPAVRSQGAHEDRQPTSSAPPGGRPTAVASAPSDTADRSQPISERLRTPEAWESSSSANDLDGISHLTELLQTQMERSTREICEMIPLAFPMQQAVPSSPPVINQAPRHRSSDSRDSRNRARRGRSRPGRGNSAARSAYGAASPSPYQHAAAMDGPWERHVGTPPLAPAYGDVSHPPYLLPISHAWYPPIMGGHPQHSYDSCYRAGYSLAPFPGPYGPNPASLHPGSYGAHFPPAVAFAGPGAFVVSGPESPLQQHPMPGPTFFPIPGPMHVSPPSHTPYSDDHPTRVGRPLWGAPLSALIQSMPLPQQGTTEYFLGPTTQLSSGTGVPAHTMPPDNDPPMRSFFEAARDPQFTSIGRSDLRPRHPTAEGPYPVLQGGQTPPLRRDPVSRDGMVAAPHAPGRAAASVARSPWFRPAPHLSRAHADEPGIYGAPGHRFSIGGGGGGEAASFQGRGAYFLAPTNMSAPTLGAGSPAFPASPDEAVGTPPYSTDSDIEHNRREHADAPYHWSGQPWSLPYLRRGHRRAWASGPHGSDPCDHLSHHDIPSSGHHNPHSHFAPGSPSSFEPSPPRGGSFNPVFGLQRVPSAMGYSAPLPWDYPGQPVPLVPPEINRPWVRGGSARSRRRAGEGRNAHERPNARLAWHSRGQAPLHHAAPPGAAAHDAGEWGIWDRLYTGT